MIYLCLLTVIFLSICLVIIVFATYYFQIKEYRFDRLISAIKEQGLLYFLFPKRLFVPKKSVRNFNIVISTTVFLLIYFSLGLLATTFQNIKIILIIASPIVSLFLVCIGVICTGFISKRNRDKVILKAKTKRLSSNATFIGITGSYGKSSTKEYLYNVLSTHFKTAKTIGNQNTNIGVALSINQYLLPDTEYFVTEMGAYKRGEIKEISDWIKPSYAVITGLSNQHLSLFGSIDNLIKAKAELIESLPENSPIYINIDSQESKEISKYATNKKIVTYSSINEGADVFLSKLDLSSNPTKAEIIYKNNVFSVETHLLGKHNLVNLLPVVAISSDLGVPKDKIISAITRLKNPYGKLSIHQINDNKTCIYDGYSSNFVGFISAIETLANLDQSKSSSKVIVTKGIIELGKEKESSYKKLIDLIINNNLILITSDSAFHKLSTDSHIKIIKSEQKILKHVKSLQDYSVILIEGRFSDKFVSALGIHE